MADDRDRRERICRRVASVFEAFYRDNAKRLCAYLLQIVGNAQAAEDVMQETFTHIWRLPNGFRPELGLLRGYLFGIARKRAAEWRGKRGQPTKTNLGTFHLSGTGWTRISLVPRSRATFAEVRMRPLIRGRMNRGCGARF